MTSRLEKLLEQRDWLLADGATGTNLFQAGLQSGDSPELWNDLFPDRVINLYQSAIDSGSDIFLTNTFGCNAARLKLHGAEKRARELSHISAEIGREVADKADRNVIVAGSMGPTGDLMEPVGSLSHRVAVEIFEEQASGLIEGGADLLWVETISAPEEFAAASEAIGKTGASWCGTMSFDTAGRTMMGVTSLDMVNMVASLPYQPIAFGANCGVGASDLLRTVLGMKAPNPKHPIIAKGNAGIPKFVDGSIHYDGTPDLMAQYAVLARNCGASIIGGCCGTMPEHLAAMRHSLETQPVGQQPNLAEISALLGDFSSVGDGTGEQSEVRRPRRRRRT